MDWKSFFSAAADWPRSKSELAGAECTSRRVLPKGILSMRAALEERVRVKSLRDDVSAQLGADAPLRFTADG